jgi:hypothetical protein
VIKMSLLTFSTYFRLLCAQVVALIILSSHTNQCHAPANECYLIPQIYGSPGQTCIGSAGFNCFIVPSYFFIDRYLFFAAARFP